MSGVVAALGKRSSKRVKAATGHGPPEVSAAPALTDERVRAIAREEIVRAARGESPGAG